MCWVLRAFGVVLCLLGSIWLLQGLNVLPGSFMSGQSFWAGAGLVTLLVGLVLLYFGLRSPTEAPPDER